jgi:hypothetical protein
MRTRPALAATLLLVAGSSGAQTSPWYVGAALSVTQEDNICRLADGESSVLCPSRSDLVTSVSLLAGLDQPIGRQRLYGDATLRSSKFKDNSLLDNDGFSLRAGLDWSTVGRLSGNLDLRADRNLRTDTEIRQETQSNIEDVRQASTTVRLGVVTEYTAEVGLSHREVKYSAASYDVRENRQTTVTAGLRWRPSSLTLLGAGLRHVEGEYPLQALGGDNYRRDGVDIFAGLQLSGASRIDARATFASTRYDQEQRDFSGVTGNLSWDWQPTGKLRVVSRLTREPGQDSIAFRNGAVIDDSRTTVTASVRADYAVSAKIRANAGLAVSERDLVRTLGGGASDASARGRDKLFEIDLGLSWEPTRSIVLGCEAGYEKRTVSGELSLPYSAGRVGCYGQVYLR